MRTVVMAVSRSMLLHSRKNKLQSIREALPTGPQHHPGLSLDRHRCGQREVSGKEEVAVALSRIFRSEANFCCFCAKILFVVVLINFCLVIKSHPMSINKRALRIRRSMSKLGAYTRSSREFLRPTSKGQTSICESLQR